MRPVIVAALLTLTATLASTEPEAETISSGDVLGQMQDTLRSVADEWFSSLIYIQTISAEGLSAGSGFIVDHDTENNIFYAATNHHVAGGSYEHMAVTTRDGRSFAADLVGTDSRYDVALIAFEYTTDDLFDWTPTVAGIGDSDTVQVGDLVYALGGPQFLPETLTLGIVSNPSRETTRLHPVREHIQTDASINQGNSGGPLVSLRDRKVIGINQSIFTADVQLRGGGQVTTDEGRLLAAVGSIGLGFAVPINVAMRIIENLREYGTPRHGYIGIEFSPRGATDVAAAWDECDSENLVDVEWDDDTLAMVVGSLTTIMNVTPLAPADRHGLMPGDVILLVDGELTTVVADTDRILVGSPASYSKLIRTIDALTPGEDSTFTVLRPGNCEAIEITLQPGALEEAAAGDRALANWPGLLVAADLSILAVDESGVAASLEIREGDVVTHVNNDQIDTVAQFYRSIETCRTERCSWGVYRNGILVWGPDFIVPSQ